MGGCRCSYKNCQNTTKTTENVHFFHYPVKHKERCKAWIENANKPHFCDLEEDQLRNKVICEHHFEDKWFPNSQKKRLLQGAIPTLDGDCGGEEESLETEMFISNGLQEIQILPASSDGSLFILDTDSNRSQRVESFVYKNGMIIPSVTTAKPDIKPKLPASVSKPSTSKLNNSLQNFSSPLFTSHDYDLDPLEFKVNVKKETPDVEPHSAKNSDKYEHEFDNTSIPNETYLENSLGRKSMAPSTVVKNPVIIRQQQSSKKANLARNYLRKIKQHSRDIACIKKMLRQKAMSESKPDPETILTCLKGDVPSTLFTVLNLNLNNNYELTEEDEDFFTTIHKISPEVYQLLVDKYKWNLPCIDAPME
ncbi:unnamed protein product [Psylliodes chrysocephalus]|uniref:THAP-type domain-containing protein n=1 Tax=Psylliodes chrysocephalus TaxID=3402493 RepID=A0A9P0G854_9CUCU|nr:unnamed protein product [Psylliodes chrysocephala]